MADSRLLFVVPTLLNLSMLLQQSMDLLHYHLNQQRLISYLHLVASRPIRQWRAPQRWYWTRPGRTSKWWDNFLHNAVDEKLCASKSTLVDLSKELCPYIQGEMTNMRLPVRVLTKVECTLFYLSDEGRLRKIANAFGLSQSTVTIVIQKMCRAISVHCGPKYIQLRGSCIWIWKC